MMILVFDLDGTLADTRQDIADAVNHARRSLELAELSLEEVTSMVGYGVSVLAQRAFQGTGIDPEIGRLRIMEYYKRHPADKAVLYAGVRETLPLLKGMKAIVSNKPRALIESLLEEFGLRDSFSYVAGGDTFPTRKPNPEALRFIMAEFRVGPDKVLVVGDHILDVQMAKAAGVKSVFCAYGFLGRDTVGADFEIASFSELPAIVSQVMEGGKAT